MEKKFFVYIDLNGVPTLTGRLWVRVNKSKETATFEYDESWLNSANKFSLDPNLKLGLGPFHTQPEKTLFGALGDSAPDRWGRVLMRRAERRRAELAKEAPRTLFEIDYLLQVNDETRQGALRFAVNEGGPFLSSEGTSIPSLIDLPRLLAAAERFIDEKDTNDDLRLLLAPGTSLGGARPKASVRDHAGQLSIAKFPRKDDEINTVLWEALALSLAQKAKIRVSQWRVENIAGKAVLILHRFDRQNGKRIPFLSAMSILNAKDGEIHSYLEIVDAIRQFGAKPKEDMHELWRRIVFNILIANVDDHLRNHAFLYDGPDGWRLSPAYDLNPTPLDIRPRILSTNITEDNSEGSLDLALDVASHFQLEMKEAKDIIIEVKMAISLWREEARKLNLSESAIERMMSAFLES